MLEFSRYLQEKFSSFLWGGFNQGRGARCLKLELGGGRLPPCLHPHLEKTMYLDPVRGSLRLLFGAAEREALLQLLHILL